MNDFILKFSFIAILFTAEIIFAAPKLNEALQENDSSSILLSDTKDPKSAAIFSDTCATCHSGGVPRAPHSTTFQVMSPDYILSILNGVMAPQSEHLNEEEKIKLSEYITGGKISLNLPDPNFCNKEINPIVLERDYSYLQWGYDKKNTRNVPSRITSENAKTLKLKWVFAYPSATRARSQPSVSGNTVFVGGQNLFLYALDKETGCVRWRVKTDGEIRSAPAIYFGESGEFIFVGDYEGNLYKVDPYTGERVWTKSLRYHPRVILTGSIRVYENVIYIPLSSREWADGADPEYQCCTFRGGLMALEVENGEEVWTTYSIPLPPKPTGTYNSMGIEILAPSGVPVWNSPTFDDKRNLIYFGTGESYSSPAADTSDSIIAVDKKIGGIVWIFQAESGDAWNMGCFAKVDANCPSEDGPDFDFGASVVIADVHKDKTILFGGRKSGHVYALDANQNGKLIWSKRIGKGGFAGGIHWGMTTDNKSIFAAVADTNFINKFPGPATPGIYSLDAITGSLNWKFVPSDRCLESKKPACDKGISAALTSTNDLIIGGGFDGWLYVLNKDTGKVLWEFNTDIDFSSYTDIPAHGGSIESDGAVVVGNNIFINSGYLYGGRLGGNVLLNFELPE